MTDRDWLPTDVEWPRAPESPKYIAEDLLLRYIQHVKAASDNSWLYYADGQPVHFGTRLNDAEIAYLRELSRR